VICTDVLLLPPPPLVLPPSPVHGTGSADAAAGDVVVVSRDAGDLEDDR
jgi:hypothetical protein